MTAPQSAPDTVNCPRCNTSNRADVRFCGGCGAARQASAPPPPPFAPPQPPGGRPAAFAASGGSGAQGSINADAETVFSLAANAVAAGGGQVLLQSPPHSMRIAMVKKDFVNTSWMRVRMAGDLVITPTGSRQCTMRIDFRAENLMTVVGTSVAATVLAVILNAQTGLGGLMLLLGIAATAWTAYNVGNNLPRTMAETLLLDIQLQAQSGVTPMRQPMPHVTPSAPAASRSATSVDGSGVVANMKKLQELRDMGALTAAEFEAKKAEILKRL